jgi:hypothetical protein
MNTPDAVYWASAFAMWFVTAFAAVTLLGYIRRLRKATTHMRERAAERSALEKWARWTMLSITDRSGMIYATTVAQLFHEGVTERVWDEPIAAALWHADAQLYGNWQQEAERLLQTVEDTEDTDG